MLYIQRRKSGNFRSCVAKKFKVADLPEAGFNFDVLICIGMIGFFGVRRQRKTSENFVRLNHPESKSHADSINDNKLPTL